MFFDKLSSSAHMADNQTFNSSLASAKIINIMLTTISETWATHVSQLSRHRYIVNLKSVPR